MDNDQGKFEAALLTEFNEDVDYVAALGSRLAGMSAAERTQKVAALYAEANGLQYFETVADLIKRMDQTNELILRVGKYGRVDIFELWETSPDVNVEDRKIAVVVTQPEDTLAALRLLDQAILTDTDTIFFDRTWAKVAGKLEADRKILAAGLYEQRLRQQQLILSGHIKHGQCAFGFAPLDGYA